MAALSEDILTENINVFEQRIKFIMSDIDRILKEKKEAVIEKKSKTAEVLDKTPNDGEMAKQPMLVRDELYAPLPRDESTDRPTEGSRDRSRDRSTVNSIPESKTEKKVSTSYTSRTTPVYTGIIETRAQQLDTIQIPVDYRQKEHSFLPFLQQSSDSRVHTIMRLNSPELYAYIYYHKDEIRRSIELEKAMYWRIYILRQLHYNLQFEDDLTTEEAQYVDVSKDFDTGYIDVHRAGLDQIIKRIKKIKFICYFFSPRQIQQNSVLDDFENFTRFVKISEFQTDDQKRAFIEYRATKAQIDAFLPGKKWTSQLFYQYAESRNMNPEDIPHIDYRNFATEKQKEIFKNLIYKKATVEQIYTQSRETLDWLYTDRNNFRRKFANGSPDNSALIAYLDIMIYKYLDASNIDRLRDVIITKIDIKLFEKENQRELFKKFIYENATVQQLEKLSKETLDWLFTDRNNFRRNSADGSPDDSVVRAYWNIIIYKYLDASNIDRLLDYDITSIDIDKFKQANQKELFKQFIYKNATVEQIYHLPDKTLDVLFTGCSAFRKINEDGTRDNSMFEAYQETIFSKEQFIYKYINNSTLVFNLLKDKILELDYRQFAEDKQSIFKSLVYEEITPDQINGLSDSMIDWLKTEKKRFKGDRRIAFESLLKTRGISGGKTKRNGSLYTKKLTKKNRTS